MQNIKNLFTHKEGVLPPRQMSLLKMAYFVPFDFSLMPGEEKTVTLGIFLNRAAVGELTPGKNPFMLLDITNKLVNAGISTNNETTSYLMDCSDEFRIYLKNKSLENVSFRQDDLFGFIWFCSEPNINNQV